jgi:autotransporter-associated beta strand protein
VVLAGGAATGAITFSGNNTFSGGLYLNGGTLVILADTGLGASAGGVSFSGNAVLQINTNATTINSSRTININTGGTASFNTGANTTIDGVIQGGGALTKAGAAILTLSGNNQFTGNVTIAAGTLVLNNAGALNATTLNTVTLSAAAGVLDVNGFSVSVSGLSGVASSNVLNNGGSAATLSVNNIGNFTEAGIVGDGTNVLALAKYGSGTLTLSGVNAYSGGTTIGGGTLRIQSEAALGIAPTSPNVNITFSGDSSLLFGTATSLSANRTITINAGVTANLNAAAATTINGTIGGANAAGLVKAGAAALTLSAGNSYGGGTTIAGGTLSILSDSSLGVVPNSPTPNLTFSAAGALQFARNGTTLDPNRTIYINNAVATFDTLGNGATITSNITGPGGGTGTVSVTGTGSLYLNSALTNISGLQAITVVNLTLGSNFSAPATTNLTLTGGLVTSLVTTPQTFGTLNFGNNVSSFSYSGDITLTNGINFALTTTSRAVTLSATTGSAVTTNVTGPINNAGTTAISTLTLFGNNTLSISDALAVWTQSGASGGAQVLSLGFGSTAIIDNSVNNVARLQTSVALNLLGGTLDFRASAAAGPGQTLPFGAVTLSQGMSTIDFSHNSPGTVLTISGTTFTRLQGSQLNVLTPADGVLGATEKITFGTTPNGGNLMGSVVITAANNQSYFATYDSTVGITTASYTTLSSGVLSAITTPLWVNGAVATADTSGATNVAMLELQGGQISGTDRLTFNNAVFGSLSGTIIATGGTNTISNPITWLNGTTASNSELMIRVDSGSTLSVSSLQAAAVTTSFLTKTGAGTLTVGGQIVLRNQTAYINEGTLAFTAGLGVNPFGGGGTTATSVFVATDAILNLNGNTTTLNGITGGGTIDLGGLSVLTVGDAAGATNYTGSFINGGVNTSLLKTGAVLATFGGNMSVFGGGITLNEGGLIYTGSASGLAAGSSLTIGGGVGTAAIGFGLTFTGLSGGTASFNGLALNLTGNVVTTLNLTTPGTLSFSGAFSRAGGGALLVRGPNLGLDGGAQVNFNFSTGLAPGSVLPWAMGDTSATGAGAGLLIVDATSHNLRFLQASDYGFINATTLNDPAQNALYTASTAIAGSTAAAKMLSIDLGSTSGNSVAVTGAGSGSVLTLSSGVIQVTGSGATQTASLGNFGTIRLGSGSGDVGVFVGSGTFTISSSLVSGATGNFYKTGTGTLALGGDNSGLTNAIVLSQGTLVLANNKALTSANTLTFSGGTTLSISNGLSVSVGGLYLSSLTTDKVSIGTGATLTIGTLSGTTSSTSGSGISLGDGATFVFGAYGGATQVFTGSIGMTAGSGTIIKLGSFVETFGGVIDTGGGSLLVKAGTLAMDTRTGSGAINNTNILVSPGATLTLQTVTQTSQLRLSNDTVTLHNALFNYLSTNTTAGVAANAGTVLPITIAGGNSTATFSDSGAGGNMTLSLALTRSDNGVLAVTSSTSILAGGNVSLGVNLLITNANLTASPDPNKVFLFNRAIANNTPTTGVSPFIVVGTAATNTTFATYDLTNGLRAVNSSETVSAIQAGANVVLGGSGIVTPFSGNQTVNVLQLAPTAVATYDGASAANLTISGGLLLSSGVASTLSGINLTFGNNQANGYEGVIYTVTALTISGNILDNGVNAVTINKAGVQALTLTGNNQYSGGTVLSAGTLSINADGALGVVPASPAPNITFGGNSALQFNTSGNTLNANRLIVVSTDATATFDAGVAANINTIAGVISGDGRVAKSGAGKLILTGNNSYTGGTIIAAGTLAVGSDGALGVPPSTLTPSITFSATSALQLTSAGFALNANRGIFITAGTTTIDALNHYATISGNISGAGPGVLAITGTGGLYIAGSLTGVNGLSSAVGQTITLAQGYAGAGTITLTGGAVVYANATVTGNTPGTGTNLFFQTNSSLISRTSDAQTFGSVTLGTSGGNIVASSDVTLSSVIGNSATVATNRLLTLSGAATFNLAGNVSTASLVITNGATLNMANSAAVFSSGAVATILTISSGAAVNINNDTTNGGSDVARFGNAVTSLALTGGALNFATAGGITNNTLAFSNITHSAGLGAVNFVTPNAATLSGTLQRVIGGVMNVSYSGSLGTGGVGSQNVIFNNATYSGGLFMNGVVFVNGEFATYTGTTLAAADYNAGYTSSFSSNAGLVNTAINAVFGNDLAMTLSTAQTTSMSGLRLAGNNISVNFNGSDTAAALSFTGAAGTSLAGNVGGIISSGGNNTINTPILWGAATAANVDLTVRVNDGSLTVGNLQLVTGGSATTTGSFTKVGAGTLSVTGTMGFTGSLFVDEGTFGLAGTGAQTVAVTGIPILNIGAGATFSSNNQAAIIGSLVGSGTVDLGTLAGAQVFTIGSTNTASSFFGSFVNDGGAGTVQLAKAGTSVQTLGGLLTGFNGGLSMSGGLVFTGTASQFLTGDLFMLAGSSLTFTSLLSSTVTLGNVTFSTGTSPGVPGNIITLGGAGTINFTGSLNLVGSPNVLFRGNDFALNGGPQIAFNGTAPTGLLATVLGDAREIGTGLGFMMVDPTTKQLRYFGSADADLLNATVLNTASQNVAYTTTVSGIGPAVGMANSLTVDTGSLDSNAIAVTGNGGSLTLTSGAIQFIGSGIGQAATVSGFDGGIALGAGVTNFNVVVGNLGGPMTATILSPFASGTGTSITKIGPGTLMLGADQSGGGVGNPSFAGNLYINEGVVGLMNVNALTAANNVTLSGGQLSITANLGTVTVGTITSSVGSTGTSIVNIGASDTLIAAGLGGTFNATMGAGGTLIFGSNNAANTVTGSLTAAAGSTLVKVGTGTQIYLGAVNMTDSATGLIQVNAGTLSFNTATNTAGISNATIAINSGGTLAWVTTTTGRFTNDAILFNGGSFAFTTSTTTAGINAIGGPITVNLGQSAITFTNSNATTAQSFSATSLARANNAFLTVAIGGTTVLGGGGAQSLNFVFDTAPTLSSTSANLGAKNAAILPYSIYTSATAPNFLTYDTGASTPGLRPLTANEYSAVTTALVANNNNIVSGTAPPTNVTNTTVNGLLFNLGAGAAPMTITSGNTLTIGAGLLAVQNQPVTINGGSITFGLNSATNNEGIIYASAATTISSAIVNNASNTSLALTKAGTAALTLSGVNNYSGGTTIVAGTLSINSNAALGTAPVSPTNNITFSGNAALQFNTAGITLDANRTIFVNSVASNPNGPTATLDAMANALTIAGNITGSGTGIVAITGSGVITVGGTVQNVNGLNALGTAKVVLTQGYGGTGTISLSGTGVTITTQAAISSGATNLYMQSSSFLQMAAVTSAQTFGTLIVGSNGGTIVAGGDMTFSGITTIGTATTRTVTFNGPVTTVVTGALGTGTLSQMGISGANIAVTGGGTFRLSSATAVWGLGASSVLTLIGSTAEFDNTSNNVVRVGSPGSLSLSLAAGTLRFLPNASVGAGSTQAFNTITIGAGASTIDFGAAGSNAATISGTLSSRALGGTLNITSSGVLSVDQHVYLNVADGLLNGVVVVNGVDFATYSSVLGVQSAASQYTSPVNGGDLTGGTTALYNVANGFTANVPVGSTSLTGLRLSGNATVNGPGTLSFNGVALGSNSGGIIAFGGANTISAPITWGDGVTTQDLTVRVNLATDTLQLATLSGTTSSSLSKVGQGALELTSDSSTLSGIASFAGAINVLEGGLRLSGINLPASTNTITLAGGATVTATSNTSSTIGGSLFGSLANSTLYVNDNASLLVGNLNGTLSVNLGANSLLNFGSAGGNITTTTSVTASGSGTASFAKAGSGTQTFVGVIDLTNSLTGSLFVNQATLVINANSNSAVNNAQIVVNPTGIFTLTTATAVTGLNNDQITLNAGTFNYSTNVASDTTVNLGGPITANYGQGIFNLSQSSAFATTFSATELDRNNSAVLVVGGTPALLGASGAQRINLMFTGTQPTLSQAYNGGQSNTGVIPYAVASVSATVAQLVTYDPVAGLRPLSAGETTLSFGTAGTNVVLANATSLNLTSNQSVDALAMSYSAAVVNSLTLSPNVTLNISSGLLVFSGLASSISGNATTRLTFGTSAIANEAVIFTAQAATISTAIADGAGPTTLVKAGVNTLNVSGVNTYSGGTRIDAGTVTVRNAAGLGGGAVTFSGLNAALTLVADSNIAGLSSVSLSGTAGLPGTLTATQQGLINASGTRLLTVGNAQTSSDTTFGGIINNTGVIGLLIDMGATGNDYALTLTNLANTYTNGTTLSSGILAVASAGSLGTGPLTFNGGTLQIFSQPNAVFQTALGSSVVVNGSGTVFVPTGLTATFNGGISGSGVLNLTGAGSIVYDSAPMSYTGATSLDTTVSLHVTSNSALAAGSDLSLFDQSTAVIDTIGQSLGNVINNSSAPGAVQFTATTGTVSLGILLGGGETNFASNVTMDGMTGITSATVSGVATIGNLDSLGTLTLAGAGLSTITTLTGGGNIMLGQSATSLTVAGGSFNGNLVGSGSVTINGLGTQQLLGTNSFFGPTNVSSGSLVVSSLVNSTIVSVGTGSNFTVNGTLNNSLNASTVLTADGAVTLSGNQTLANLTGAGSVDLSSTAGGTNPSGAQLTLNAGNFAGQITGGSNLGSVVVAGASQSQVFTFSSASGSSYGAGTNINTGSVYIANTSGSAFGTGAANFAAGTTLLTGATATVSGPLTIGDGSGGARLDVGTGVAGTLNAVGGLTLNGGSTISFILGASSSTINLGTNNLTLNSGTITLDLTAGAGFGAGQYQLFSYNPSSSILGSGVLGLGTTPAGYGYTLDYGTAGLVLLDVYSLGQTLTWSASTTSLVDGAGTWDLTNTHFVNSSSANVLWGNSGNDTVVFGSGGDGGLVTLDAGTPTFAVNQLIFAMASSPYTISGTSTIALTNGIIATNSAAINAPISLQASQQWSVDTNQTLTIGAGISAAAGINLTFNGPGSGNTGTFVLAGNNTYVGNTTITAGAIVSLTGSLASPNIFINSDSALAVSGVLATSVNVADNGTFTVAGNQTIGALNGAGTTNVNSGFTLTVSGGSYGGQLNGAGNFAVPAGTVTLAAANGLTGTTTVSGAGQIVLAHGNALQFSAVSLATSNGLAFVTGLGDATLGGLAGAGDLFLGDQSSGAIALHVGGNNQSTSYGGILSGSGASALEKLGNGTLTLSGANSYSGSTTVSGGILALDAAGSLSSQTISIGAASALHAYGALDAATTLNIAGGTATFEANQSLGSLLGTSGSSVEIGGNSLSLTAGSYSGTIHGAAGNLQINGNTTLLGTIDVGGTLTIAAGVLVLDGSASVTTPAVNVLAGATLDIHATGPDVLAFPAVTLDVASMSSNIGSATFAGSQTLANLTGNGVVGMASGGTLTLLAGSFSGIIGGGGSVVVNPGVGNTLTLSGAASTYTGGTTLQSGTLVIAGNLSLGAAPATNSVNVTFSGNAAVQLAGATTWSTTRQINIANGVTAIIDTNGVNMTTAAVIGGLGGVLRKDGAGTLALTGASTYSGGTIINGGVLLISTDLAFGATSGLPSTSITFSANSTLTTTTAAVTILAARNVAIGSGVTATFNTLSATSVLGAISGTDGVLAKTGASILTLAGDNQYTGGTVITAGTIYAGSASALGTGVVTFGATTATLDFQNQNLSVNNIASSIAAGGLITNSLASAATLTVSGSASTSYAGVINDGAGSVALKVALNNATLTLSGTNTFSGGVTLQSGTLVVTKDTALGAVPGSPTTGITFSGNSVLGFSANTIVNANRTIAINNGVQATIDTQAVLVTVSGAITGDGSLLKVGAGTLTISGVSDYTGATTVAAGTLAIGSTGSILGSTDITVTGALVLGAANAVNSTVNVTNAGTIVVNANQTFGSYNDGGVSTTTIAAATTLTLRGGSYGGAINGAGALAINSAGTVTLSGLSGFTGGVTLAGGTLSVALNSNLGGGAGPVTFNGGILRATGTDFTSPRTFNVNNVAGNVFYVDSASAATISGPLAGAGTLSIQGGGDVTFGGNSVAFTGAIAINGSTVFINSNNALSGGSVVFNDATAALDLSGTNANVGNLVSGGAGFGYVTNSAATPATLTVNGASSSNYSGVLADGGVGTGTLGLEVAITGGAALTLSGNNSYTGATNLSSGTLAVTALNNLGAGAINFNGGTLAFYGSSFSFSNTLNVNIASTIFVDTALTITSTGTVNGSTNDLTKAGAGTLVFEGNVTGNLEVTNGTVQANPNNIAGNIVLSNNSTIEFTSTGTFGQTITGVGNVGVVNSTVTLTGTMSTYSGNTYLNAATLVVGNAGSIGVGGLSLSSGTVSVVSTINGVIPIAVANGTTNTFSVANNVTFGTAGAITGNNTSTIVKDGLGAMILSGDGSGYAGSWAVNAGTLAVAGAGTIGSGNVTVSAGGLFALVNTSNVLTNAVTLYDNGAIGFQGNNTFGGTITVTTGTGILGFDIGSNTTLTGTINKNGTTVEFYGTGANVTIAGSLVGSLANSDVIFNSSTVSATNYTLTASQDYNGPTFITNGSILTLGGSNLLPGTSNPSTPRTAMTFTTSSPTATSTFNLQTFSDTVSTLATAGTNSASTVITGQNGSTLTVAPTSAGTSIFAGHVTGQMSLAFNGVGGSYQVFTGISTYTGSTTINSGALLVNGSITGAGDVVTINSGGTLGGGGAIERDVTVGAAGTIAPGSADQTAGQLSLGSVGVNSALAINGTYLWDLGSQSTNPTTVNQTGAAGASFDQIALIGSLTLNSSSSVFQLSYLNSTAPTADAFWANNHSWDVISGSFASPASVFGMLAGTGGVWNSSLNRLEYSGLGYFDMLYGTNAVQLDWVTAVPEPGSMLLGSLAALGLGGYGWRRRKAKATPAANCSDR